MFPDAFKIRLDSFEGPIPAVRIRLIQETMQAAEFAIELGLDVIPPEGRRALHQIVRAAELGDEIGVTAIMFRGFHELGIEDRQLLDIILRGHLPE